MGRDLESGISGGKEETEHWKLTCLVPRHHNSELQNKYMECCEQVKKSRFEEEEGFNKKTEIPETHDDPNIIVYKRRKYTDIVENDDQRVKCQCARLNQVFGIGDSGRLSEDEVQSVEREDYDCREGNQ